jgi:hypothetical protein
MPLILIGLSVAVTLAFVYCVSRIRYWSSKWYDQWGIYTEVLDRALQAEAAHTRATTELQFLKNTLGNLLTRPVQAVLTEEQMLFLSETIGQFVAGSLKSPDRLD